MGGPRRQLLIGLQATEGVLPATMFQVKVEIANDPDLKNVSQREQIPVHNGTDEGDEEEAGGSIHSELNFSTPLYYDTLPLWLCVALGTPTSTAVVGESGAFDHVFKRSNGVAPPFFAAQFFDDVDGTWTQALDMVVNTWKITQDNDKAPRLQIAALGKKATNISAPTVPAISVPNGLAAWRGFRGDVNSALSRCLRYSIDGNDNRTPRYTGNDTSDPDFYMRGLQEASLDSTHRLIAYAGSYNETFDNGGDLANWQARYKNTAVTIGSATNPTITILVPNVKLRTMERPNDGPEKVTHLTAAAGFSNSLSTRMTVTVRNTTDAYTPD